MRHGKMLLAASVIGLIAAGSGVSHATTFVTAGGNSCQAQTTDAIMHSISGVNNPSTSVTSVFMCPLNFGTQVAAQTVQAVVVRAIDNSTTSNFSCTVYETTAGGGVFTSSPKYVCTTAGGCPDPTTSFTGANYLQWNTSELNATLRVMFLDGNYGVVCNVPPKGGGADSRITSYYSFY